MPSQIGPFEALNRLSKVAILPFLASLSGDGPRSLASCRYMFLGVEEAMGWPWTTGDKWGVYRWRKDMTPEFLVKNK